MSTTEPYADLPHLDVFSETYANDPYPLIAEARRHSPVARSERGLEFLSHATCEKLLMDRRLNSGMRMLLGLNGITEGPLWDLMVLSMLGAEGDLHRRLRGAVMPYFNTGAARRMREASRRYVTAWLGEAIDGGECDYGAIVGRRLPSTLFCDMIGAPEQDWRFIAEVSEGILRIFTFAPDGAAVAQAALQRAHDYLTEIIAERRRRPGEDLISAMLAAQGEDRLSDLEVMDLALTILGGATDNTNTQMGLNLMCLAENPDSWRELKHDRSLIAAATLECTRWKPGFLSGFRVPEAELDADGVSFGPEVVVNTNVLAGNRDPAVYPDADRFDIHRKPIQGLNFGHGRHFCVGRPIALVEMEEGLRAALDLWEEFAIEDSEIWGAPATLRIERLQVRFAPNTAPRPSAV